MPKIVVEEQKEFALLPPDSLVHLKVDELEVRDVNGARGPWQKLEFKFKVLGVQAIGDGSSPDDGIYVLIKEVKVEFADIIREKHVTIEANNLCCPTLIIFQFRQLLLNLISNAIKFSKPDVPPHITISSSMISSNELNNQKLQPDKSYYLIVVRDNGIGFDARFSERIFEVFQKFHNKELYGGSGMGLAVVKKIVENHNGIITATSELNKGATFNIYIPASQ